MEAERRLRGRPPKPMDPRASPRLAFAVALRDARRRAGITQGDLAAVIGRNRDYLGRVERGTSLPSADVVQMIRRRLGDSGALEAAYSRAKRGSSEFGVFDIAAPLDVIGVGMSNVDLIAGTTALSRRSGRAVTEYHERFEWGAEDVVAPEVIDRVVDFYGADLFSRTAGGSVFNAVRALAELGLGLHLGYVSLVDADDNACGHLAELQRLGVDATHVEAGRGGCGRCISYVEDGERRLLTSLGGNIAFGAFLNRRFHDLVAYLVRARLIHVHSLPHPEAEEAALALLKEVRGRSPVTRICVDPGYLWVANPRSAAQSIIQLADYVLVSHREFKLLGRAQPGETDEAVARRALDRCGPRAVIVVADRYGQARMFLRNGADVSIATWDRSPIAPDFIEDATGAGDLFAAGFIAALSAGRLQSELGVLLGMALATRKLAYVGTAEAGALAAVTREVIDAVRRIDSRR